jgi:hypothetical protein
MFLPLAQHPLDRTEERRSGGQSRMQMPEHAAMLAPTISNFV